MGKWIVTGADSTTGTDRTVTIDAASEEDAIARGNFSGLLVEKAVKAVPPVPMKPPPPPAISPIAYRAPSEGNPSAVSIAGHRAIAGIDRAARSAKPTLIWVGIGAAIFFGLAGIIATVIVVRAVGAGSRNVVVPISATTTERKTLGITYAQLTRQLGPQFVLEKEEKTMDGLPRFRGVEPGRTTTLVIEGDKADISYAHLFVELRENIRVYMISPDGIAQPSTPEMEEADASLLKLRRFIGDAAPDWPGGEAWLRNAIVTGKPGGATVQTVSGRKIFSVEVGTDWIKLAVIPL